jgi:hypothetical protein
MRIWAGLAAVVVTMLLIVRATSPAPVALAGAAPATSADPLPALRTQANRLVDATGQTVQLRGVNRSGTEYACIQGWGIFSGPNDAASILAMKLWGVNAVRVPLNEDCWLGINGAPAAYSGAIYQQAIRDYVGVLNQNGMYAIVDLHLSAPGTALSTWTAPMPDLDHTPDFWSSVATTFKGNDTVVLEVFNEPYPDGARDSAAGWVCWRDGGTCPGVSFQVAGMQTLVNAIRATGATNVIALGGLVWSNSLTGWLAYKPSDPLNNLVATWHVYNFNACSNVICYDAFVGPVAAQVPVLATEIGTSNCDQAYFNTLMSWLDARQQGYLAWTWTAWGGDCSGMALITDYSGTPSPYGQIYQAHLATFR